MELTIFVVDAFTESQFKGNSAAVIPLKEWIPDQLMQHIAAENNLSETAFIKPRSDNKYEIRWFSPLTEIDFCGHATLASSFVLFNYFDVKNEIEFVTLAVGNVSAVQLSDGRIQMSFPNQQPELIEQCPQALIDGLSIKPQQILKNRQAYFAVLESQDEVLAIEYDSAKLKQLAPYDLVVTARGGDGLHDFVSRYFWPTNGGGEDPVTGSIHAGLTPYWASILGKEKLIALQASKRAGKLYCEVLGERILVSGFAVFYLQGKLNVTGL
ncbi:PhzF family phenazine biosynthesis protein [Psychromonas sp. RZ22]|uniref:PhzF family phenazine biosynthesis protein n=1 Tax=Psychromonas algarum TaxID=2555643 RepID=UPI001067C224|nr:PhzF family phenazine biosynthesis protein [Psychromonas sp. RZ22]TEW55286.1 PhzF family phenazine biosynthesis protein [Psychromonas sp. RZ22]